MFIVGTLICILKTVMDETVLSLQSSLGRWLWYVYWPSFYYKCKLFLLAPDAFIAVCLSMFPAIIISCESYICLVDCPDVGYSHVFFATLFIPWSLESMAEDLAQLIQLLFVLCLTVR